MGQGSSQYHPRQPSTQQTSKSLELAGLPLRKVDEAESVVLLASAIEQGQGGWIVTANADIARQCYHDPALRAIVRSADLIVADGMPLIWASRIMGQALPGRVCGSDLVWSIAERGAAQGFSVFLLGGGDPGTADRAASILQQRYPDLRIAGTHYPPFGFESSPEQMQALRAKLERARPDVVYVALGFPKAERLIHQLREEFPQSWWVGVGISLSFIAGEVQRAPRWMRAAGLEWLHRLLQEPGRLVKRYLWYDIPFVLRLLSSATLHRLRHGKLGHQH